MGSESRTGYTYHCGPFRRDYCPYRLAFRWYRSDGKEAWIPGGASPEEVPAYFDAIVDTGGLKLKPLEGGA